MNNISRYFATAVLLIAANYCSGQNLFVPDSTSLNSIPSQSFQYCVVDMNGDFLDDVVRVGGDALWIDRQNANGTFTQVSFFQEWLHLPQGSICAGDLNNDGFNDLFFADFNGISTVINNGLTSISQSSNSLAINSGRSTLQDIDNDGDLDAFVCNRTGANRAYRNGGDGNMTYDNSLMSTTSPTGNYSAIWSDINNDHKNDLYISKFVPGAALNDPARKNQLYRQDSNGIFSEVAGASNMDNNGQTYVSAFGDFDNDGDMDAVILNHEGENLVMENDGNGVFSDVTTTSGFDAADLGATEIMTADFDNDGWLDIFSESDKSIYLNSGGLYFQGLVMPFDKGAIGDLNNDGFLDIHSDTIIWINDGNANNWIKVVPTGVQSNLNGIGARVEIYGSWGVQVREIRSGVSATPMNTLNAHFGIGPETTIDSLRIIWPAGHINVVPNPTINSTYNFVEDILVALDDDQNLQERLLVWPNPTDGVITVRTGKFEESSRLELINSVGQLVSSLEVDGRSEVQIDLTPYGSGNYHVQLVSNGRIYCQQVSFTK